MNNLSRTGKSAVGSTVVNFIIGSVAGLVSVFVPRLMLLLSVDRCGIFAVVISSTRTAILS